MSAWVTQDLICICRQNTFSPASSINSSQTDKSLPVKTSKQNFVTFLRVLGTACYGSKLGRLFCLYMNLRDFGAARSEDQEVNSTGYPEFKQTIRARKKHYPLFKYGILNKFGAPNSEASGKKITNTVYLLRFNLWTCRPDRKTLFEITSVHTIRKLNKLVVW